MLRIISVIFMFASTVANAAINKCVDKDGNIYFTDQVCPPAYELKETRLTETEKQQERFDRAREESSQAIQQERDNRDFFERIEQENKLKESVYKEAELKKWHEYKDGSHGLFRSLSGEVPAVERHLRSILKYPDSLIIQLCDPVMTNGSIIKARCQYRAKNALGAYVNSNQVFHFNSNGTHVRTTVSTGKHLAFEN